MSQEKTQDKVYTYTDKQINAVLAYLGEQKAKDVIGLIQELLKPVKIEVVPSKEDSSQG